jgi:hypothetical protein
MLYNVQSESMKILEAKHVEHNGEMTGPIKRKRTKGYPT